MDSAARAGRFVRDYGTEGCRFKAPRVTTLPVVSHRGIKASPAYGGRRYSRKVQQRLRPASTSYDPGKPLTGVDDLNRLACNSFTPRRSLVRSQYRPQV